MTDDAERQAHRTRSEGRRKRIVGNKASNWREAEQWDLAFWQSMTPQQRLSALVDLRECAEMITEARNTQRPAEPVEGDK